MATGRASCSAGTERDAAVDDEVLATLAADLGADHFERIWTAFLREAGERSREILAALDADDAGRAAQAAHRLKSAGGFFGARSLARLCAEVDERARAGEVAEARACAVLLAAQVEHLRRRGAGSGAGDPS